MFKELATAIMMEVHYCSSGFWTYGDRHGFAARYGATCVIPTADYGATFNTNY